MDFTGRKNTLGIYRLYRACTIGTGVLKAHLHKGRKRSLIVQIERWAIGHAAIGGAVGSPEKEVLYGTRGRDDGIRR